MLATLDTNILVSALWSKNGTCAKILQLVLQEKIIPCFDYRIMTEYREVLLRPKFKFSVAQVSSLLNWFEEIGCFALADFACEEFLDEEDKKFYEVAQSTRSIVVTGNIRNFPKSEIVITPQELLKRLKV